MEDKRVRILIVDDDEAVLIALEHMLEGEGYCTVTAWSGREALELLQNTKFDLLMVDEHLSDLSAVDLFSNVQRTQHQAYRFLMSPFPPLSDRAESIPLREIHASVCKWEHGAIRSKIRSYLPGEAGTRRF